MHGKPDRPTVRLFDGFSSHRIQTQDATLYTLTGGAGPPLLLLHGYPQNHFMWHAVAERLKRDFSLIIPDLRGYGQSMGPPPDEQHLNYSKRTMGRDMIEMMATLGYKRFAVAGHDRGGRVAYRLALDHPEAISSIAVLDIIPQVEVWERMDGETAKRSFHWLLLAQPTLPDHLIACDPDFFMHYILDRWAGRRDALCPEAVDQYVGQFHQTSVITAVCEDYRAGAGIDVEHDCQDRDAGRKISCPLLLLWSRQYLRTQGTDPADIWRNWARDVRDVSFGCGHFIPEEEPDACAEAMVIFFMGKNSN